MSHKRLYSAKVLKDNRLPLDVTNIHPYFVSGFSDGEASFSFTVSKNNTKRG